MLACNKYISNILYSTFYPFSIFPYCAIHRARNEGSGRFHNPGSYKGLLLIEIVFQRFHISNTIKTLCVPILHHVLAPVQQIILIVKALVGWLQALVLSSKGDWEEKLENINHPLGNLSCFKLGPVGITAKLFMVQLFFSSATPNIKLCPGLDNTCVREYGTAVTKSTFSYKYFLINDII